MEYIKLSAEGNVGVLTINRPAALNALNDQVIRELDEALDSIDLDSIRCLVVTGEGLHIGKLSLDGGELHVDGRIDGVNYEEEQPAGRGLFSRLFA